MYSVPPEVHLSIRYLSPCVSSPSLLGPLSVQDRALAHRSREIEGASILTPVPSWLLASLPKDPRDNTHRVSTVRSQGTSSWL